MSSVISSPSARASAHAGASAMPAYRVSEARTILKVSRPKLYQLILTGALPAFRVGRDWRVSREALAAFIQNGGTR